MKNNKTAKFLNIIETVGNKLPHPATLFLIFSIIVVIFSTVGYFLNWQTTYTGIVASDTNGYISSDITVFVMPILSNEGLIYFFSNFTTNFTSFAPLGTVLVAIVGIGIAERTGLISVVLRKIVLSTPSQFVTSVIVFLGVISNTASDAGYIVLPPLAGLIFLSLKRHPIAGISASFAGVSGGFSANLLISTLDPLLAGFTEEASHIIEPNYVVSAGANYIFMAFSTFLITIVGTLVTEKIIEPRLGSYKGDEKIEFEHITETELRALKFAGFTLIFVVFFVVFLWFILGQSIFLGKGIVPIIALIFAVPSLVYGKFTNKIKNDTDVMAMISESFSSMGSYLVLVFFASQFINLFNYSNLGTFIAVFGSNFLSKINAPPLVLLIIFIFSVAIINLFMGSSSAKWAILAPIFVPMLMKLGTSPEATQLAYRIGDSSTNLISPLMSYFSMMVIFIQKYDKKASIGTLISTMLPYSIAFILSWTCMLIFWVIFDLPIGFGAKIFLW
ncbi:MAG: AbgT family transporter [Clostridia bacterium]